MSEEFPVHWLGEIIEKILERNESLITLATGKTPSGYIHIGILREIVICDSIRRVLEDIGKNVKFFLFLDSLDAAKRFPDYINQEFQAKHLGKPFSYIPCPFQDCQCESWAYHFGNDLSSTLPDFGIKTEIVWTHELYKTKEMQEKIKIALENTEEIKKIMQQKILPTLSDENKPEFMRMQKTWMPAMVVCEKCEKIQHRESDGSINPNRVINYLKNELKVTYSCTSCGHAGEISIYSGNLKLNWRVDWPAKWSLYRTTCEPAGKDHSVKGGAYDTGLELCKKLYDYIGPVTVPYEWLRLGDRDMKTSKGIVFTPKKYLEIAEPEVFRTLILRTNPLKHISFRIEEMYQYYDFYERMENVYFSEEDDNKKETEELRYIFPLTQIHQIPEKRTQRIPFKLLIFLSQIQNILTFDQLYDKAKKAAHIKDSEKSITKEHFRKFIERITNWIELIEEIIGSVEDGKTRKEILRKIDLFTIKENIDDDITNSFTENQKKGIRKLRDYLTQLEEIDADDLQNKIFTIAKEEIGMPPRKLFEAIYNLIFGKKSGPRLGAFLSLLDKKWLLERLDI
ncbi:MAG: lysine--tRNA ligase [Promethearchaeota archaeon]